MQTAPEFDAQRAAYREQEDSRLIEASRHDPDAFAALYHRYADAIFWYLVSRTGSPDDAADLTQLAFLRAYQALPTYRERGLPFRAWLLRIARNAAADAHRRRRPTLPWDRLGASLSLAAPAQPEIAALEDDLADRLRELIAQLGPDKQELLALRYAADLTIREIAALRNKSEAATRKELQRIIWSLKEDLLHE